MDELYPIRLYIYDASGHYGAPVEIDDEAHLNSMGIKTVIRMAMDLRREIRMTDPMDRLVFHAVDGSILFPSQEDCRG